jgi:hypothetical protein
MPKFTLCEGMKTYLSSSEIHVSLTLPKREKGRIPCGYITNGSYAPSLQAHPNVYFEQRNDVFQQHDTISSLITQSGERKQHQE